MLNIFRYLRAQRNSALWSQAACRLASLVGESNEYRYTKFDLIGRPLQFSPTFVDFFLSPVRSFYTVRAQFKYFRASTGIDAGDFSRHYERLLAAYSRQRYGVKLNLASLEIVRKLESDSLSQKEIRKILDDTTLRTDARGQLIWCAHHRAIEFFAKAVTILSILIGLFFLSAFVREVFWGKCIPLCVYIGALDVSIVLSLVIWISCRIGFRVSGLEKIIQLLDQQNSRVTNFEQVRHF